MDEVNCVRCGRTGPTIEKIPYGGKWGEALRSQVCADCWKEWKNVQLMIINEYQLNMVDEHAQEFLDEQMKSFLNLNLE